MSTSRPVSGGPPLLQLGRLVLDLGAGQLRDECGLPVPMRPQAWSVLRHLALNAGRLISRAELFDAVWPHAVVTDGALSQAISDLREVLGADGRRLLHTYARRGYVLMPDGGAGLAILASAARPTHAGRVPDDAPPPTGAAGSMAERRQLTVLCIGLAPGTVSSPGLEALFESVAAMHRLAQGVIERHGGTIVERHGEGLVTLFGWPRAGEHDAERALCCALALLDEATRGGEFSLRAGAASGDCVTAVAPASPVAAVGDALRLARRLELAAGAGEVLVADGSRRLVGTIFDFDGPLPAGPAQAQPAWRLAGIAPPRSRFDALRDASLSVFAGRRAELARLLQAWRHARRGRLRSVLLWGEAGIGKSRLVRQMLQRPAPHEPVLVALQCSPLKVASALHPFVQLVAGLAGIGPSADRAEARASIGHWLPPLGIGDDTAAGLLADLVAGAATPTSGPGALPARRRDETLGLLADLLCRLVRGRPAVLLIEDVHWLDPTSTELLQRLSALADGLSLLLLMTARPAALARGTLTALVHERIRLPPLGDDDARQIVARIVGPIEAPAELLSRIVARADGVPLHVEELSKAVVERWTDRDTPVAASAQDGVSADAPAVPMSLRDSLVAQLDRFPDARVVLQCAACIGREFETWLVGALSGLPAARVAAALRRLVDGHLVLAEDTSARGRHAFRHALLQEAAAQSLLADERRELHRRIVALLAQHEPSRCRREPELLARHHAAAGQDAQAVACWIEAAQQALERFANDEAAACTTRALARLDRLAAGRDRDRLELAAQTIRGTALGARGYTAEAVREAYARAWELCSAVGAMPQMLPVLFGLWIYYIMRAEFGTSHEVAGRIVALGGTPDSREGFVGSYCLAGTHLFRGELHEAARHGRLALECERAEWDDEWTASFGCSPRAGAADWTSMALWFLGEADASRRLAALALRRAHEARHPLTLATVLVHRALLEAMRGRVARTLVLARRTIVLCRASGILIRQVEAELLQGWALARIGRAGEGLAAVRASMAAWNGFGAHIADPIWHGLLADALRAGGQPRDAVEQLQFAIERSRETGEGLWLSGLQRLLGETWLEMTPPVPEQARRCFDEALATARSQGACWLEGQACASVERLRTDAVLSARKSSSAQPEPPLAGRPSP